ELLLRRKPDVSRRIWQSAVLVDNGQVSGADHLPGEALLKVRVNIEHGLLSESHGILHRAMVGKLTHVGGQERGHVARRRIDLAGAGPLEDSGLLARPANRLTH